MIFEVGQKVVRMKISFHHSFGVEGETYVLTNATKSRLDGVNIKTGDKLIGADPWAFRLVPEEALNIEEFV